jgi:hypothetical protein
MAEDFIPFRVTRIDDVKKYSRNEVVKILYNFEQQIRYKIMVELEETVRRL